MRALSAAISALRQYWTMFLATFLVTFGVASLAAFAVYFSCAMISDGSALFERGMDGDLPALIIAMNETPAIFLAPIAIGFATLLGYAALSWFLCAGVIGVLREKPTDGVAATFGAVATERFFSFLRLAIWSLAPLAIVLIVTSLRLSGFKDDLAESLTMQALGVALAKRLALPLAMLWILWTVVDVARIHLVIAEKASAWRAIGRAVRTIAKRPGFLAITLAGHLLSGLLIFVSIRLVGLAGGFAVFAIRQLLFAGRHAIHIGVIAAEVDRFEGQ